MSNDIPIKADSRGMARWLDRQAMTLPELQHIRELFVNGYQANATQFWIDFWTDPSDDGEAKLIRFTDNGESMDDASLRRHIGTMFLTGRDESLEGNYGIGARLTTLGRNPAGVTWACRALLDDGRVDESEVKVARRRGEYAMVAWDVDDGRTATVVAPSEGILSVLDDHNAPSGTAVVLHGHRDGKNTWDARLANKIARYMSERFFVFPEGVELRVRAKRGEVGGAEYQWRKVAPLGENYAYAATDSGSMDLSDGSLLRWWVFPPATERAKLFDNKVAAHQPYIGALRDGETFNLANHSERYRAFGLTMKGIIQRVAILVEPPTLSDSPEHGARMNEERDALVRSNGRPLPWAEWGQEFVDNRPEAIDELMRELVPKQENVADLRARIEAKFGTDWEERIKNVERALVARARGEQDVTIGDVLTEAKVRASRRKVKPPEPEPDDDEVVERPLPIIPPIERPTAWPEGEGHGSPVERKRFPIFKWIEADQWPDDLEGRAAAWNEADARVELNMGFALFVVEKEDHAKRNPAVLPEHVAAIVEDAYGFEYVAKLVHVLTWAGSPGWDEESITRALDPLAMTTWAAGFNSVTSQINAELDRYGR